MRLPYLFLTILLAVNGAVDYYIYRVLRDSLRNKIYSKIQAWSAAVLAALLIVLLVIPVRTESNGALVVTMWLLFVYASIYIPKILFTIVSLFSQLPRLWGRKPVIWPTLAGAALAAVVFVMMWWGALVTRFSIDVSEVTIESDKVPEAFDGLRIVQISDLHVGTYGSSTGFVEKLVDRINSLNPDIIVFTGDIVNRNSDEVTPFIEPLSHLHAPMGVYSVLGNHDYGDYSDWNTPADKEADHAAMIQAHRRMGWHLLNNESVELTAAGDTIVLIGVENIGDPPFAVYGDLKKAYPTPGDDRFKILLSHNPAHWDSDIEGHNDTNIALTLSGHTHAMQMSLFGASPSALRYDHWGGLYTDDKGQALYVNIGTGTVGYPARFGGANPEITVFTLKHKH